MPTGRRNQRRMQRNTAAAINSNKIASHLHSHRIKDLLYRVLANPCLDNQMFVDRYTSIGNPASDPWHGYAWRTSYTMTRGPDPPCVGIHVLYPGCFILLSPTVLFQETNAAKVRAFNLPSQLSASSGNTRPRACMARVCSVIRSSDSDQLQCEFDPIVSFGDLPRFLQTDARKRKTKHGAEQLFLVDYELDKPTIDLEEIISIIDSKSP